MSCHEGKGRRHRRFKWEFWKKGRIPPVTDADVFDSRYNKRVFESQFDEHLVQHTIAFLGNPNVGKSSLFNILTGSHQHIGNWPGKTVEKKVGDVVITNEYFRIVDLPGSFSLTARSEEEEITRQFIVEEDPDLVCVIVDATRLERTMYIAFQAMELTDRVAIIVNMMDVAEKEGIIIDQVSLSKKLGVPVVLVSAFRDNTALTLRKFLYDAIHTEKYSFRPSIVIYPQYVEKLIMQITQQIEPRNVLNQYPARWVAIKLLEGDQSIIDELNKEFDLTELFETIAKLEQQRQISVSSEISRTRYHSISRILTTCVKGLKTQKVSASDKIDRVLLHPVFGYVFLVLIYSLFFAITFYATSPILDGIDTLIQLFSNWLETQLINIHSPAWIISLLINGVIAGVGAILLFLPIIFVFYALIAVLEDSGYLARSAYLMDRVMNFFGLQGTSFLSMMMGFGCNVAGILATRTIKQKSDRIRMIISASFIPCAARLGVIAFLTSIFFNPLIATVILISLYGSSLLIVLMSSLLFGLFFKKDQIHGLILEIPDYRKPRLRNIYYLTWERSGVYLKKAGTIIFFASIFIWFISAVPFNQPMENTIVGYIGRGLSVVSQPLFGFDWKMVVPLIFGVAAKETILSGLSILYTAGGKIIETLQNVWTIPQALSFLFFQQNYLPCFATMATVYAETKNWKITLLAIFYPLILTSVLTAILYQILRVIL
ncbi:MAG: ferrous iron transport protein B [Candidatus Heimdallarchaeaceae archaeon]